MYQALPQHQQRIMDPEAEYVTNPTDHLIYEVEETCSKIVHGDLLHYFGFGKLHT